VFVVILGAALMLGAVLSSGRSAEPRSGRQAERVMWRRLWRPMSCPLFVLAALLGWILVEPERPEVMPRLLNILSMVFVALLVRAAVRAGRAVWPLARARTHTAATVGLLRPRVFISARLEAALDERELRAVLEHERAHAGHRDPLRIWAAQLATDLQWPVPAAAERFRRWSRALELARDEEARERGVDGADLASAVIASLRLSQDVGRSANAPIAERNSFLEERIGRLLSPVPDELRLEGSDRPRVMAVILGTGLASAAGALFGETLVRFVLTVF
jgi:hypothetical protein